MIGFDDISGAPSFADQDTSAAGGGWFQNSGSWTINRGSAAGSAMPWPLLIFMTGVMLWLALRK